LGTLTTITTSLLLYLKYSCPEGTYGDKIGASDVSDCKPCTPGYYCPSHPGPPSTLDTQVPCGEVHLYCPKGSSKPLSVDLGFYSIDAELSQDINTGHIRTDQVECELGFYCQNGLRYPCRAGTYGESLGLSSEDCSGLCPRGSFCPVNSIHPLPCSPGAYSTGKSAFVLLYRMHAGVQKLDDLTTLFELSLPLIALAYHMY